ncbi:hypothetical protein [Agromyces allii]|uniref:Uncharacterized protein n=1 Tax=Agromyces allii TaxID=393607 RepID=A0ABN2Q3U0_9MICO|nr:hypothetical protein [Agromyces allii]
MTILLILAIAALAVWAVAGAFFSTARDGYHRLDARDVARRTPVSID